MKSICADIKTEIIIIISFNCYSLAPENRLLKKWNQHAAIFVERLFPLGIIWKWCDIFSCYCRCWNATQPLFSWIYALVLYRINAMYSSHLQRFNKTIFQQKQQQQQHLYTQFKVDYFVYVQEIYSYYIHRSWWNVLIHLIISNHWCHR